MKTVSWLSKFAGSFLAWLRKTHHQARLRRALRRQTKKKIVIGSSGTRFEGWIPTDQATLNLLVERDWLDCFPPASLDAILAEHVWEHLTPDQALAAAAQCYKFLRPGGYLRVAVPDGCHPDPGYIEAVRPGGSGEGAEDHRVLYTHDLLREVFAATGFEVVLYEYFDAQGKFHGVDWEPADGMVWRSRRFDNRNADGQLRYTSIILDAVKPSKI